MPTRSSKPKAPGKAARASADINETAFRVMLEATGQAPKTAPPEKNPAAVALGKLGGAKGGKARAAALTPARKRAIAKKAAKARWGSKRPI